MKEIKLSFDINLTLKQYDVHWIEQQFVATSRGGFFKYSLEGTSGD